MKQDTNYQADRADVLSEISSNSSLYADEVAERLGMSTKLVVELIGKLFDEGIVEYDETSSPGDTRG